MEINYGSWDEKVVKTKNESFQNGLEVLKWAYEQYEEDVVYACSFGAEGIVLLDLISTIKKDAKVVFLDTQLHFQETYDLIEKVKKRYPLLQIIKVTPSLTLKEQEVEYGEKLFETNPSACCKLRKVEPLRKVLVNYSAWISGLRREQSETRRHVQFLNQDPTFQNVKICPLIHWTKEEVWHFIKQKKLDYHPLHDEGYPSIGCYPCTQKPLDEKDERSGRWVGFQKTECGLHFNEKKKRKMG